MKVLILGGGGEMGRVAAREAAVYDFVEKVTVADVNLDAARAVAATIGGKATAVRCDVSDLVHMSLLLAKHDVVLNTVGPFYRFGVGILNAVIAAGKHYADICDDWEPTLEMLQLDSLAKANGVVAIVGMGASPGLTNLLGLMAGSSLDQVNELLTGWSIVDDDQSTEASSSVLRLGPSAASVHWLRQLTGTIRQQERGELRDVKPLQRRVIAYPGYGSLPVWTVGHPEAVTFPRTFSSLITCANVMVGGNNDFDYLKVLVGLVNSGILSIEEAATLIDRDSSRAGNASRTSGTRPPELFAWARGSLDGKPMIASAHLAMPLPGGMGGATATPLALTLPLFARGFDSRCGVFTPDELLNPKTFIERLAIRYFGMTSIVTLAFQSDDS
jgi:saccharopine dehydrogenase-like NADP-dependent oxidoreductase